MAKGRRKILQRRAIQAIQNIDDALFAIQYLQEEFEGADNELTPALETAAGALLAGQDIMYKFCIVAWMLTKERIKSFR